jgi:hypothetical protein
MPLYIGTIGELSLYKTTCLAHCPKAEWIPFRKLPASFYKKYIYALVENNIGVLSQ